MGPYAYIAVELARPIEQLLIITLRVVVRILSAEHVQMSHALSNVKSSRGKVPSCRLDLSMTGACSDAASGNGDGKMGPVGAGAADQHGIALVEDGAAGQIAHERLVDGAFCPCSKSLAENRFWA